MVIDLPYGLSRREAACWVIDPPLWVGWECSSHEGLALSANTWRLHGDSGSPYNALVANHCV